jgi:hypothetical protein
LKQQLKDEQERSKKLEEQLKTNRDASDALVQRTQHKLKQLQELQTTLETVQAELKNKHEQLDNEKKEVGRKREKRKEEVISLFKKTPILIIFNS